MIDWQFKIMDYITDQLENVPNETFILFTKEELYKNVCPNDICWAPFGTSHFWPIPELLELCGIKVNSGWKYTMETFGYFAARKSDDDLY